MKIKYKLQRIFALSLILIVLSNTILAQAKTYHLFKLDLKYLDGNITLKNIKVEPSLELTQNPFGLYLAEILDFEDNPLNITYFEIPLEIYFDVFDKETREITGGGVSILNETEITLFLPYYENAKEINIYDKDFNKKLTIDVSDFSEIASTERKQKISEDIKIKPEAKIPVEKKGIRINYLIYLTLALIIVLIIILLVRRLRKNNNQN